MDINIKTVAPYNHQSLQAEHGIKFLLTILMKHLTCLGQIWPKYLPLAIFAYNMFNTPKLANYSPYEWVLGRKPKLHLNLETMPDIKFSGTFKDYYNLLTYFTDTRHIRRHPTTKRHYTMWEDQMQDMIIYKGERQ